MAARLIDSLWVASYGSQLASGRVYFYAPGTTTPVTVYQDDAATVVVTQPVSLDANGRTVVPIYATAPMRAVLFNSAMSQIADIERIDGDRAELVALVNSSWPASASENAAWTALATSLGALNGLTKVVGTGAVERTVQAKNSERRSVKDFGAAGTGTSDDYGPITAAIAAVSASGGGELLFPPGTYLISQALVLASGVSFKGASATTSVIRNSAAGGNCITGTSLTRFYIEDIGISHSTASTLAGILLTGCSHVVMSRLRITGHRFCIDSTDTLGANVSQNHRIRDCELLVPTNAAARCVRMNGANSGPPTSGSHNLQGNAWGESGGNASTVCEILGTVSSVSIIGNAVSGDTPATGLLINAAHTGTGIFVVGNDFAATTTIGINIARATGPSLMEYANRLGNGTADSSNGAGNILGSQPTQSTSVVRPTGSAYYTQTIAGSASAVISLSRGNMINIQATGAGTTITIPTVDGGANIPPGSTLTIQCHNNSGGAVTWTFDAAYILSAAVAPASPNRVSVTLRASGGGTTWYEVSRVTTA